jgi:formylglycine-generating enzyme required for sulfatase activity
LDGEREERGRWEWLLDADPLVQYGPHRVYRGGNWSIRSSCRRLADRSHNNPGYAGINIGFRVCLAPVLVK